MICDIQIDRGTPDRQRDNMSPDPEGGRHNCSKTCVKRPHSKRAQIGFQDQLLLNAGQKYSRMLPLEHSAICLTFIKLPFVIKIFVLSIFEWLFYTGFQTFTVVFYN